MGVQTEFALLDLQQFFCVFQIDAQLPGHDTVESFLCMELSENGFQLGTAILCPGRDGIDFVREAPHFQSSLCGGYDLLHGIRGDFVALVKDNSNLIAIMRDLPDELQGGFVQTALLLINDY